MTGACALPAGTAAPRPAAWGGVMAMALCVFALIASEFMPISLLTPIAADLHISEGVAGQGLSISGAFAVLMSLSISALSGKLNRKTLLLGLTAAMCVSGAVIALAQGVFTYMIGRALIGVVVGGFWSLTAATAMRLVPAHQVPRALAIFNAGNALATIVAAPLGSYLGSIVGWRGTFFCLVPVALAAFAWQSISLPAMHVEATASSSRGVLRLLGQQPVRLGMLAVGTFFMGQFMLFTYLRPFLETVTQLEVGTLSLILLTIGVAGFVGTSVIGKVLARGLFGTLIAIPLGMAAIGGGLIAFGGRAEAVTVLLAAWGLLATAAPVGWWSWIARTLPQDAEVGGGLMVAVIQLAIALGATLGGVLFDASGYRSTFAASTGLLLAAAWLAHRTGRAAARMEQRCTRCAEV